MDEFESETSEGSVLRQSTQVSLQGGEQSGEGCSRDLRDKWEIASTDGQSSKQRNSLQVTAFKKKLQINDT